MSTESMFSFPFTPPSRHDAEALARAACFLLRAANEARSVRMGMRRVPTGPSMLEDFESSLSAAGHLCDAVAAARRPPATGD
jgi:hypothetical protein